MLITQTLDPAVDRFRPRRWLVRVANYKSNEAVITLSWGPQKIDFWKNLAMLAPELCLSSCQNSFWWNFTFSVDRFSCRSVRHKESNFRIYKISTFIWIIEEHHSMLLISKLTLSRSQSFVIPVAQSALECGPFYLLLIKCIAERKYCLVLVHY